MTEHGGAEQLAELVGSEAHGSIVSKLDTRVITQ